MSLLFVLFFLLITVSSISLDYSQLAKNQFVHKFIYMLIFCLSWIYILSPWRSIESILPSRSLIEFVSPRIAHWMGL